MDLEQFLRPRRKSLVLAAESVITVGRDLLPEKSQLNRLVAVCGEATCTEEIANYLRYQSSRRRPPWKPKFAELVIEKIGTPLEELRRDLHQQPEADHDRAKVAAWRLYAVFLNRALTYAKTIAEERNHDRARR